MNRPNRRILVLLAIGLLVVGLGLVGIVGPLRTTMAVVLGPVTTPLVKWGSGFGGTLADIGRVGNLARDNARLAQENAMLRERLAADAETRADNDTLRRQLGLELASVPKQVGAEVRTLQPDSYRQFLTISRGSQAGIKAGQAVLSDGVLVGLVQSVQSNSSVVRLIDDPEFRIGAKDQDRDADGIIQGQLGGGLVMEKIDQTKQVRPGDTVTTSGLGGLVPAGLLIGQIQSVDSRQNVIFQTAEISSPIQTNRLRFVFVVTP